MEFTVRGKIYSEAEAIQAIVDILKSECKNGKLNMEKSVLPTKMPKGFKGIVYRLYNDKPQGYVVIDQNVYRVYFYNADGIRENESMSFVDYLIDTDYKR